MRKGLALEMIIMLIMLLVVAGVIISVFIGYFQSNALSEIGKETVNKATFQDKCEKLCREIDSPLKSTKFCETFNAVDWNDDGLKTQTETLESDARIMVCENRVYCFQIYKCPKIRLQGSERYQIEACRRLSCDSFASQKSPQEADALVAGPEGKFRTGEDDPDANCKLDFPNWYTQYVGDTPCSNPPR